MEKEQVWIMRKHWPLLATFVTGFILSQLVFPQKTETRWMVEEVIREVTASQSQGSATSVSSQTEVVAVEKRNLQTTETREPVLLGLDASGVPIVEFRHQITLTDLSFRELDTETALTQSEMANTSTSYSETERKAVNSGSAPTKIPRYRMGLHLTDTWMPKQTVSCVSGASGWLGCAELVEVEVGARLGDMPLWLGASFGLRRWGLSLSYEF